MEHAAQATGWLAALQAGPIGLMMRQSPVLYPIVEILHILGFCTLYGAIASYDLAVLRRAPAPAYLWKIAGAGLAVALPMGVLLFSADAGEVADNPMFQAKLALIGLALVNVAVGHLGPIRMARPCAAVSLTAWTLVIICGRMIAYV